MAVVDQLKLILITIQIIASSPFILSKFLLDVSLCLIPPFRQDKRWTLDQAIRVRVVRLVLRYYSILKRGDRLPLESGKEGNRFSVISPIYPKLYQGPLNGGAAVTPQRVGATWTPAQPPPPSLVGPHLTVALHFHGGGFVIGDGRDGDAGFFAQTLIKHTGCTHVCSPQYRLSSHRGNHFPAQLQDALTAYMHLLRERNIPASQIIVSGDSAGGNMVMGLLRYIHEYGKELNIPNPAAALLWSPWVDVSAALSQDMRTSPNYKSDYLNSGFGRWGATTVTNFGAIDPINPYLAPLHHPFQLAADLPVFVNAGGREVLEADIAEFVARYKTSGCSMVLHVSPACPHDILLLGRQMGFHREGEEAAREAKQYLLEASNVYLRN